MRTKRTQVVRDEILRPARDPREVANTELIRVRQRSREGEPGRVAEPARALSRHAHLLVPLKRARPNRLGNVEVEAEEIALVVRHVVILPTVDSFWTSRAAFAYMERRQLRLLLGPTLRISPDRLSVVTG